MPIRARWRRDTPARQGNILTGIRRTVLLGMLRMVLALCLAGLAGALGLWPQVAHAQALDLSVSVCNTYGGVGQPGTLGDALAQAASNDGSVIGFACDGVITVPQTITVISNTLTIKGNGHHVTLTGDDRVGVFSVISPIYEQPATLTLDGLTVAHGKCGISADTGDSITISNSMFSDNTDIAICNGGYASITNSTFIGNSSTGDGLDGSGGAIWNSRHAGVSITNSTFIGNTATGFGGGVYNVYGGGVSIANSTFSGNTAIEGGGVFNTPGGYLDITNSTFSGNTATKGGGGVWALNGGITNSTFSGNTATEGGGVESTGGEVVITNSTFSGNIATGGSGGGVENTGYDSGLTITNSTFSGNMATVNGGGVSNNSDGGSVWVGNSILVNNKAATGEDCYGPVSDGFYNLTNANGGGCGFSAASHDVLTNAPRLGPLAHNGGPTQTMALLPGSPAINQIPKGANGGCFVSGPYPPTVTTDQRGVSRPQRGRCDIGAYEATSGVGRLSPGSSGTALPIQASLIDRTSYNATVLAARMEEFLWAAG